MVLRNGWIGVVAHFQHKRNARWIGVGIYNARIHQVERDMVTQFGNIK